MARGLTQKKRLAVAAIALAVVGSGAWYASALQRTVAEGGGFWRDRAAGFIVTEFAYALGPETAKPASCPAGMSKGVTEIFGASEAGIRKAGETDEDYTKRLEAGGKAISVSADGKDYCTHPRLAPPDIHARYLTNPMARADGLNLDAKVSPMDFTGLDGTKGVDNQFWRVAGCTKPYQPRGTSTTFGSEMYTGAWGLLIALDDLDNLRNDEHVVVHLYSNADPMQISPTRQALDYATYAFDRDPRYQAQAIGKLKDGVLTTNLFDFTFKRVTNAMYVDRPLNKARIRATLSADGTMKGYLSGYTSVEQFYDFQFGYRTAKSGDGKPADPRRIVGTANGAARTQGYTCQGMYQGLQKFADGDWDERSGTFKSISTQYRFRARPAFVVEADTASANDGLVKK